MNNMTENWIPINRMRIPSNAGRVLLYTPSNDETMRYRITSWELAKTLTEATHWQPCLPPDDNV